jgi:hypothetical protein
MAFAGTMALDGGALTAVGSRSLAGTFETAETYRVPTMR